MKNYPTVFIICGVHNHLEYTKKLLTSITDQKYKKYQVLFVDDGSTDGTTDFIQKRYAQKVNLIKDDGNLWWTGCIAKGVDVTLKIANRDDFILIINNDCIFESNYLDNLVQLAEHHPRTVIGSLIVDLKDKSTIVDGGVKIDWSTGKFIRRAPKSIKYLSEAKRIESDINTLSTKGTLYPIEVFQNIGNFDQKHLPHYISDYEFACRAKKAGYPLLISYDAIVYNIPRNTGFGEQIPQELSYRQLKDLLFNRRSRINIIDHLWFITLCCPTRYRLKNYFILILKTLYLISLTYPLNILRKNF